MPLTLTTTLEDTGNLGVLRSGYAICGWHFNRAGEHSRYSSDVANDNTCVACR